LEKVPDKVEQYAPTLIFSKGEKYFPCDMFFSGKKVVENKQEYDKLSEQEKLEKILCYYHINIGQEFIVYQYWYYYAHNPYRILWSIDNNHEHDFECFKLFVGKESTKPEYFTCNIHNDRELTKIKNGKIPIIQVELGGHGLYPEAKSKPWYWIGEKDHNKTLKIKPLSSLNSCENLRLEVSKKPFDVIDKKFKIIGSDYSIIGKGNAPTMPWIRWEYYLPEMTLLGIQNIKLPVDSLKANKFSPDISKAIQHEREMGVVSSSQYLSFKSEIPELPAENKIKSYNINKFFTSEKYGYILNEIGINSMNDVIKLEPKEIHLRLDSYNKKNNLKIAIPSIKEIEIWQKELISIFSLAQQDQIWLVGL